MKSDLSFKDILHQKMQDRHPSADTKPSRFFSPHQDFSANLWSFIAQEPSFHFSSKSKGINFYRTSSSQSKRKEHPFSPAKRTLVLSLDEFSAEEKTAIEYFFNPIGLPELISLSQVKSLYRQRIRKTHPDANNQSHELVDEFMLTREHFRVLEKAFLSRQKG